MVIANYDELLVFTGIVFLIVGAATAFTSIDLPGTGEFAGADDGEQRCDITSEIAVDSGVTRDLQLNDDSFFVDQSPSGFFSLNVLGPQSDLSFFTAENVKVTYNLNGPIDGTVREVDDVGKVGQVTDSKISTFSANNLPEGSYVLSMDLSYDGGSDFHQEDIEVSCGGVR